MEMSISIIRCCRAERIQIHILAMQRSWYENIVNNCVILNVMLCNYVFELKQNAFYRTGKHIAIDLPNNEPIVVVNDAPQHEPCSVDYGAVVLYVIHKHISHEPAVKSVAENKLKRMRANIVNSLLL